jgi:hypothetical protein
MLEYRYIRLNEQSANDAWFDVWAGRRAHIKTAFGSLDTLGWIGVTMGSLAAVLHLAVLLHKLT